MWSRPKLNFYFRQFVFSYFLLTYTNEKNEMKSDAFVNIYDRTSLYSLSCEIFQFFLLPCFFLLFFNTRQSRTFSQPEIKYVRSFLNNFVYRRPWRRTCKEADFVMAERSLTRIHRQFFHNTKFEIRQYYLITRP